MRRVAVQSLADLPATTEFRGELCFRDPAIHTLGLALLRELEAGGPHGPLFAESLATALITVLFTRQEPWRHRRTTPAQRALAEMRAVCDYIESHLDTRLHLEALSTLAGLGPERFRLVFRATLGESPHRYVLRRRLDRARDLLRNTALPITEIAHRLGFADHSHLTSTFHRETGLTPSRFRAEARR